MAEVTPSAQTGRPAYLEWPPTRERETPSQQTPIQDRYYFFYKGEPRRIETVMWPEKVIFFATAHGGRPQETVGNLLLEGGDWHPLWTREGQMTHVFSTFLETQALQDGEKALVANATDIISHAYVDRGMDQQLMANLVLQMIVELQRRPKEAVIQLETALHKSPYTDIVTNFPRSLTSDDEKKIHIVHNVIHAFDEDVSGKTSQNFFRSLSGAVSSIYDRVSPLVKLRSADEMKQEMSAQLDPLPTRKPGTGSSIDKS